MAEEFADWKNDNDKPKDFKESKKGYRGFIGTWNNYSEEDYEYMCALPTRHKVVGKEVGKCGTPHLQFALYFEHQKTFSALHKILKKKAHVENAHNYAKCVRYCKKDGNFFEDGEMPERVSVNVWSDITRDITNGMDWADLLQKYPEASIKFSSGLRNTYETLRPKYQYSVLEKYGSFLPWQSELMELIKAPAPDRTIVWYCDIVGGHGKTDMAQHLVSVCGWLRLTNGKTADIALAWNGQNVVFDFSRSQAEHINYGVIEDIKNGAVFSGKYQSVSKMFARPWVIVFANSEPDQTKMSADRWDIRYF